MMTRLIGFPTREMNSSQASLSQGPAHRQTMSFSDSDEYRVDLSVLDILAFFVGDVRGSRGTRNSAFPTPAVFVVVLVVPEQKHSREFQFDDNSPCLPIG